MCQDPPPQRPQRQFWDATVFQWLGVLTCLHQKSRVGGDCGLGTGKKDVGSRQRHKAGMGKNCCCLRTVVPVSDL